MVRATPFFVHDRNPKKQQNTILSFNGIIIVSCHFCVLFAYGAAMCNSMTGNANIWFYSARLPRNSCTISVHWNKCNIHREFTGIENKRTILCITLYVRYTIVQQVHAVNKLADMNLFYCKYNCSSARNGGKTPFHSPQFRNTKMLLNFLHIFNKFSIIGTMHCMRLVFFFHMQLIL